MTDKEIKIAIAEACGFNKRKSRSCFEYVWVKVDDKRDSPREYMADELLDYVSDLNAIHQAEQILKPDEWHVYFNYLVTLIAGNPKNPNHNDYPKVVHASAKDRAEALLRTVEYWKE